MLSLPLILLFAALVITLVHGVGKGPLWPAVLLTIVFLWIR